MWCWFPVVVIVRFRSLHIGGDVLHFIGTPCVGYGFTNGTLCDVKPVAKGCIGWERGWVQGDRYFMEVDQLAKGFKAILNFRVRSDSYESSLGNTTRS